jgi:hypothetical protein
MPEEDIRAALQEAAQRTYGQQRAIELDRRLGEVARWLALIEQQPLDLLDEEPDDDGR